MKRIGIRRARAAVAAALIALGILLPAGGLASGSSGALVATASATFASCPSGSDHVVISGVTDPTQPGEWFFSVTTLRAGSNGSPLSPACLVAGHGLFQGTWSPARGGEISGLMGAMLFLGPVPRQLSPTSTDFGVCLPVTFCANGTATVTRY
ncbi:MAG: hypothetical protein HY775_09150 [Acidobacteria bacterium]|nr:hypothetical protein [Acidobacteriota bacterium]